MRRAVWLLGVATAVLATACGTTAHVGSAGPAALPTRSNDGLSNDGLSNDGLSATGPTPTVPPPLAPGGASAALTASSASVDQGAPSTPVAPALRASNGKDGPGVTASGITIGLIYVTNSAAYEAALGNTAVTTGDQHAQAQLVVNDINATGGIAGRKLAPQYLAVSATDSRPEDQQAQAACASFTQDHKVFGVVPGLPFHTPFNSCMTKAGAVIGSATITGTTAAEYRAYPNLYDITSLNVDRLFRNLVSSLVRQSYFTPWDATLGAPGHGAIKLGIVAPDTPEYAQSVKNVLVPALAQAGFKVASNDTYLYSWPQSTADDGATIADIQAAELRLRSDGVTHVIAPEVNGLVFFGGDADRQHYRPRYSLDSADGAQGYAGNLLPVNQLNGMVGLGYLPMEDVPFATNPDNGPYSSADRRHCLAIMKAGGQGNFTSANAETIALSFCDLLFTMRDVINHIPTGQPINQATFTASLASLGPEPSGNLPKAFFGTNHTDAVTEGWDYQYFANCTCFHYTGAAYALP